MNFLLGLLLSVTLAVAKIPNLAVAKRPNILFILTDDQGKYLGGLDDMPQLQVVTAEVQVHWISLI